MIKKQQAKSVRILIAAVSVVLFLTCFQLMQVANAVVFNSEDGNILQTGISDKTSSLIMMAQANNPKSYTVIYHPGGGSGKTMEISVDANTKYKIENQGYIRKGYVFRGWNTSPDGEGTVYYNEQVIDITGNVTLFAIWTLGM